MNTAYIIGEVMLYDSSSIHTTTVRFWLDSD